MTNGPYHNKIQVQEASVSNLRQYQSRGTNHITKDSTAGTAEATEHPTAWAMPWNWAAHGQPLLMVSKQKVTKGLRDQG